MNLRKDHSHISYQITVHLLGDAYLWGWRLYRYPHGFASGASGVGRVPKKHLISAFVVTCCCSTTTTFCSIPSCFQGVFFYWTSLSFRCVLLQLSAMDVLARIPMKGAAKCDEHCELQNSVNQ